MEISCFFLGSFSIPIFGILHCERVFLADKSNISGELITDELTANKQLLSVLVSISLPWQLPLL